MTTSPDTRTQSANLMRDRAGTADPAKLPFTHHCGARWSGNNTSHCAACHDTFSGVGTFDRHRRDGRCVAPYHLGMSLLAGRAYDVWGYPGETTAAAEVTE